MGDVLARVDAPTDHRPRAVPRQDSAPSPAAAQRQFGGMRFSADRHGLAAARVQTLQRAAGNRATSGLIRSLSVQREPADSQLIAAMDKPDPVAGVGDYPAAFRVLNGLAMVDILTTLSRLRAQGRMSLLESNFGAASGVNTSRLRVAFNAVNAAGKTTVVQFTEAAGDAYRSLPLDQQADIARFLDPSWTPTVPIDEIPALADDQLGAEYTRGLAGDAPRLQAVETEVERRGKDEKGWGTALASPAAAGTPGTTAVTPDVAIKILENLSKGEPPFKPELGKGGASWFVTEGAPHVGIRPDKSVNIDVEVSTKGALKFGEPELLAIFKKELEATKGEAELKFRERYKVPADKVLSARLQKQFKWFHERFAESRMWDRVGERVAASPGKVGEVSLQGSRFSTQGNGKFAIVADAKKIKIKGGPSALLATIEKAGLKAEPVTAEAAAALAKKMQWAGKVKTVLRWGGRVAIVVAVAADAYHIYYAQDKVKAVIESAGGWAGATAGAAAFAAFWAPADVTGPWAWAIHGVGTLVSGAVGYWVGSEVTRTVYELVVE